MRLHRRSRLTQVLMTRVASVLVVALVANVGQPLVASANSTARLSDEVSWTVYHGNTSGSGVAQSLGAVNTSRRAWSSRALDGQIFGEPLVWLANVYVATENDTVYALSARNGGVLWSRHLASAVTSSSLPCGNISPTVGITGTPVIDPSRREIFVVADEMENGAPAHRLVGLNVRTGAVEMNVDVDPPGADPSALLQRTGLTIDAGQVIFGMGGNYGDCGSYRGRVVAVSESGSRPRFFTVDARPDEREGAIWMGGAAPIIDHAGHVWVSAGNGSSGSGQPYDYSDSVLELSSTLHLMQYFAPRTWAQDNASDLDMSTAPAVLANGLVVAAGKSGIAYLLSAGHLGGIGGERASLASACANDISGGSAFVGSVVYLPCLSGIVALRVAASPPSITLLWSSGQGGGPPIVAAGRVWTIGQDGILYGLDPSDGALRQRAVVGAVANHFPTPGAGDGLLLAPSADRVIAFHASSATS